MNRIAWISLCAMALVSLAAQGNEHSYSEQPDLPSTPFTNAASAVKNVPLGGGFFGSLGGSLQWRAQDLTNRRTFEDDNTFSLLARERINAEIHYGDEFRVFVEAQDAHEIFNPHLKKPFPNDDALDIYQCYVETGLFPDIVDKPSLIFRIGRQELIFGQQKLFSNQDWLNTGQSFDVARAIWRPDGFQIDAFAGWPSDVKPHQPNNVTSPENIAGINLKALGVPFQQTIEAYAFYKWNDEPDVPGENGHFGPEKVLTYGARADGRFFHRWDYDTELALQAGERNGSHVCAGRGSAEVGYILPFNWRSLRLAIAYTVASGDRNPTDQTSQTFDPLFGDQFAFHGKILLTGPKNLNDLNPKARARVWRGGLIELDYHWFRLNQARDAYYLANGNPLRRDPTGQSGKDGGRELDIQITHTFHENLSVTGGMFLFQPGSFFERAGNHSDDNVRSLFIMVRAGF